MKEVLEKNKYKILITLIFIIGIAVRLVYRHITQRIKSG